MLNNSKAAEVLLISLIPNKVTEPDKCEIAWCSNPNKPTAFTTPAINASVNAPYSTHFGSFVNIGYLLICAELIIELVL